ncbi:MAG: outer membrane beta-barrel protein [Saprospiraceae bacterium]|nr:outer membrane beta-barrel protein [Saprospiraceae bacterium]
MRKLLFILLAFMAIQLHAQKQIVWFDAGLKAQYGASGFYSKAVENATGYNHELGLTSGFGYGGKLGINWQYNGLSLEAFYNKSRQDIEVTNTGESGYSYEWKAADIYALYRNAKNLGYFELGPKVSLLQKMDKITGNQRADVKESFNNTNFAGVLGFGANIMGNDGSFSGILGLRFEYGFTDIVKTDVNNHPIPAGLAGRETTNPYFAGLVFELNWGIGYFGRAQCGARSKFIMF